MYLSTNFLFTFFVFGDLDQSDADLILFSIINILLPTDLKARENKN